VCRNLEEKAWKINVESSDMIYTDALEYYSQVQDADKRKVVDETYKDTAKFKDSLDGEITE